MEIIKPGTRFDFVGKQKPFLILSGVLITLSFLLMATVGFNFGVDFQGGSEIILAYQKPVTTAEVRDATANLGFAKPDVQRFGSEEENRFLIRVPSISFLDEGTSTKIKQALNKNIGSIERFTWSEAGGDVVYVRFDEGKVDQEKLTKTLNGLGMGDFKVTLRGTKRQPEYQLQLEELQGRIATHMAKTFGEDTFTAETGVERVETVGPRVGEQLRNNGIVSVMLALLFILIYIAFRFDVRYAPGAVAALFHDVIITLGLFSAFQFEVSLPIIAAMLTIVGYSLNDTIVIFDRIRENFGLASTKEVEDIVNISINDSLSRTLLTSVSTLIAVLALAIFGGGLIRNFAVALIIGVIVGTYSSSFIASPIMISMHHWLEKRKKAKAAEEQQTTPTSTS